MTEPKRHTGTGGPQAGVNAPASCGMCARKHYMLLGAAACLLAFTGGFAASALGDTDTDVYQRGTDVHARKPIDKARANHPHHQ